MREPDHEYRVGADRLIVRYRQRDADGEIASRGLDGGASRLVARDQIVVECVDIVDVDRVARDEALRADTMSGRLAHLVEDRLESRKLRRRQPRSGTTRSRLGSLRVAA